jgi:hypothetical protein
VKVTATIVSCGPTPLSIFECRELLGVGGNARLLNSEHHEHATLWHDPVLQGLEAVSNAGDHWHCLSASLREAAGGGRVAWARPSQSLGQLGGGRRSFLLDVVQLLFPPLDSIPNQVAGVLSGKVMIGCHLIGVDWRWRRLRCVAGNCAP